MLDDIDRDCCSTIERAIKENLPEGWTVAGGKLHDPGMTIIVENENTPFWNGNPTVTIEISYGRKRGTKLSNNRS